MFSSLIKDIKQEYNYGNMVTRLIIVNVAVFIVVNALMLAFRVSNGWELPELYFTVLRFFCVSSDWWFNLTHPWVFFTSMFVHEGFFHLLFNMLFLYWFGTIVRDFIGNPRILQIYVLGGLVGAFTYFLTANILPYGSSYALGASAGTTAILVAAGVIAPDYTLRLLFVGNVKLKYIVLVVLILDLVGIAHDSNTGGHFAHIGGAIMGWLFISQLQQGNDLGAPLQRLFDKVSHFKNSFTQRRQKGPRLAFKNPNLNKQNQTPQHQSDDQFDVSIEQKIDEILEKIKQEGIESLTPEEKSFLDKASNKKK